MTTPPAPQRASRKLVIGAMLAGVTVLAACGGAAVWIVLGNPPESDQQVAVTSCEHSKGETRVGFTAKNTTTSPKSFRLRFRVTDASGKELSEDVEYVRTTDPGAVREDSIYLRYAEGVGSTCEYLGEE